MSHAAQRPPTVEDVRAFWEAAPLFTGESRSPVGTREWFEEHEAVYLRDCLAGAPSDIFTRGLDRTAPLLDVGCGPGFWVRFFARAGFTSLQACDLTAAAVALTQRSLALFGFAAQVQIGNAEALPYASMSFAHINCQGVLHHTPDPAAALREFARVLRPGGTACLSVYRKNLLLRHPLLLRLAVGLMRGRVGMRGRGREGLLNRADAGEIVRRYDGNDNPLGVAYTPAEFEALLTECFSVEAVEYFFFPARAFPVPFSPRIHRWLGRHLGLLVVVRVRKRAEQG